MKLILPSFTGYPIEWFWDHGWQVSLYWKCRWFYLIKYQKTMAHKIYIFNNDGYLINGDADKTSGHLSTTVKIVKQTVDEIEFEILKQEAVAEAIEQIEAEEKEAYNAYLDAMAKELIEIRKQEREAKNDSVLNADTIE